MQVGLLFPAINCSLRCVLGAALLEKRSVFAVKNAFSPADEECKGIGHGVSLREMTV